MSYLLLKQESGSAGGYHYLQLDNRTSLEGKENNCNKYLLEEPVKCDGCCRRSRIVMEYPFVIPSNPVPSFVPLPQNNILEVEAMPLPAGNANIPIIMLPPPRFYEGPEASWPSEKTFNAVYLGTDDNNRIILQFNDERSVECYTAMKSVWGVYIVSLGKDTRMEICDLEVGLLVIACHKLNGQNNFFRGQVISIQEEGKTAVVRDVDEWDEIKVLEENLYWMNESFLKLPFQAIACELRGLNFFNGCPVIKTIMDNTLKKIFPLKSLVLVGRIEEFEGKSPYPLVNISNWPYPADKLTLDEEIKRVIKCWGPVLPYSRGSFYESVLVSHADVLGNLWLQVASNLTHFVTHFEVPPNLQYSLKNPTELEDSQCSEIFASIQSGETNFLGQYEDKMYYRAVLLHLYPDEKLAIVDFIDFGNKSTIKLSQMISYDQVFGTDSDCSLVKSIVPQCVKVHMSNIDVINLENLWGYVPVETTLDIMISITQRQDRIIPEVELYSRSDNGDMHHLNKFFLLTPNIARNIGDRKIGTNIRIPGTKKFLTEALIDDFEADSVKLAENDECQEKQDEVFNFENAIPIEI